MVGAVGRLGTALITTGLATSGVRQVLSLMLLTDNVYAPGASEAKVAEAPYTPLIPYSTLA